MSNSKKSTKKKRKNIFDTNPTMLKHAIDSYKQVINNDHAQIHTVADMKFIRAPIARSTIHSERVNKPIKTN